ncbi:50S ribosomal protein L9 [Conexibacter sp. SYSU D00693]|uniref:50S ribosomal protein L9 n=1 Tax=Conexibacter sp. SYSU D00693 TaxID=2812560 RepID=UPI00196ADA97|nr:50S ribosomal protein L9 [Conexibacter sp. SYSU D00693]
MPSVILLQDVDKLGQRGEVVDVSKGYLRNFLIPRKLAQPATKGAMAEVQRLAVARERQALEDSARAAEVAEQLDKTVLTIEQQAGDDGRLFGSVTAQDVVDAIQEARGVALDRRKVQLEQPIKTTGTHVVTVEVAGGITADVKVMVVER